MDNLALALKLYQENAITLGKAANLAGISLEEMIEKLGMLNISIMDYSIEELKRELKDFG